MRKIEYLLIGIVAVFVAIILPTFNKGHDMDFGSTSDFVSALSSLLTLGLAIIAYSKWQDNKYRDDSYEIQKTLIAKNYIQLFNQLDELKSKFKVIDNKFLSIDNCYIPSVIDNLIDELENIKLNLTSTTNDITNNLRIMAIFNCYPNEIFNNVNSNLLIRVEMIMTHISITVGDLKGLRKDEFDFMRKRSFKSLKSSPMITARIFEVFSEGKKYIYNSNKTLHELFIVGSKNL
jgi:hypothetical protein